MTRLTQVVRRAQAGGGPHSPASVQEFPVPDDSPSVRPVKDPDKAAYGRMVDTLRGFLDKVAAAKPDAAVSDALARDLAAWNQRLGPLAVDEPEQLFGRVYGVEGNGQTLTPAWSVISAEDQRVRARVRFGRFHVGRGAVHGGAIALIFDEVMGMLGNTAAGAFARTAYIKIDYRSVTLPDRDLELTAWIESHEGRKHRMLGQLHDGDRLCAEGESLFITLKPGQP
jgi:acyl-coenzyme A thioesterase PaaI-like protein